MLKHYLTSRHWFSLLQKYLYFNIFYKNVYIMKYYGLCSSFKQHFRLIQCFLFILCICICEKRWYKRQINEYYTHVLQLLQQLLRRQERKYSLQSVPQRQYDLLFTIEVLICYFSLHFFLVLVTFISSRPHRQTVSVLI